MVRPDYIRFERKLRAGTTPLANLVVNEPTLRFHRYIGEGFVALGVRFQSSYCLLMAKASNRQDLTQLYPTLFALITSNSNFSEHHRVVDRERIYRH
jgi:hypothetical protein